jgi:hypothetical protein
VQLSRIASSPSPQTPCDAAQVVQQTINSIIETSKRFRSKDLGADEILPLFEHVFLTAEVPGALETAFFMANLMQQRETMTSLGWATTTLEGPSLPPPLLLLNCLFFFPAAIQRVQELADEKQASV